MMPRPAGASARRDGDPRPDRPEPFPFPAQATPWLDERMFDHRIILARGRIDAALANHVAGALFVLGRTNADPVQLYLSAPDGELASALAIVDAMEASGVAVHVVVTSEAGGAALAVLAAAEHRSALAHARIRLAEPRADTVAGTADEVAAAAGRYLRDLEELIVRLTEVTGQARSRIENDLSAGRILTAEEAQAYGLIDEVTRRPPRA